MFYSAKNVIERDHHVVAEQIFDGQDFEPSTGRAPYRYSMARDDGGVRLFGGGNPNNVLVEISGRGCDGLRNKEIGQRVAGSVAGRCTRFDYAVDIRTGVLPVDFTSARKPNHFKHTSIINSKNGQTVYLGSPRSDRFARVYRYYPPHPRHQLLRSEFVFRRGLAKSACGHYAKQVHESDFTATCGNTWGIDHEQWQPGSVTDEKLRTVARSRPMDQTLSWLYSQVAPAIARLIKEDAIDLTDWLEHVYAL